MANKKKRAVKKIIKQAKKNPKNFVMYLFIFIIIFAIGAGGLYLYNKYIGFDEGHSHEHHSSYYFEGDVEPMSINFLELGNQYTGDSTFIKAGDVDILIDAGSRNSSSTTIKNFIDKYCTDNKLEYVIATHSHQDHIAGFVGTKSNPGIFDTYKIDTLIDFARTDSTSAIYTNYVTKRDAKVVNEGMKHYTALQCYNQTDGAKKVFDIGEGIKMEILYQKYYEEKSSDENNYSVCTLFTQGNQKYLFTGDLEASGEKSLVANNDIGKVTLFKGGHHGSYTANTDDLLSVIKPDVVCICCCAGSDEYSSDPLHMFPAQEAINRIGKYTEKIYVTTRVDGDSFTSMNGDITFYCLKGEDYTVSGSNNSTILKDTDWFKTNRTWPSIT